MEAEILKIICANQGAVDTDDLLYNLFFHDPSKVSEIICNREKFASCCPNGQPKVVARTRLRLCRHKDCPGTCRSLHLCKNFLFSGFCHLTGLRRGCSFSHELNSDHNQRLLTEHELESLSREELCTLLLQSDTLLPEICHDYNNGDGEFGKCNDGDGCKRLHICEQYVRGECSCLKNHSFSAPQPLKIFREKNIPGTLFQSLKPVYANREALRLAVVNERGQQRGRGRGRGRGGNQGNRGGNQGNKSGNQGNRGGRGTRGSRGNRGNQSGHPVQHRTSSLSDLFAKIDTLSLYTSDGLNEDDGKSSPSSDVSAAANDTDASSENGETRRRRRRPKKVSADVRGRGGNRGNHQPLQKTRSSSDIHAAVGDEAAKGDKGQDKRQRPVRDKTEICMYFIKGHCIHEDRCFKAHDKMPYRWEVQQGVQWTALPENETIERDYCDPSKSYSSTSPPVYFGTMTCGSDKVRRLSTENSVIEPTFIHTTEWLWYWEDEFGKWNSYSSDTGGHKPADITSTKLEEKFLTDDKDVVEFTAGSQSYSLSFQDMIQTNKRYGTKKLVCRRPRFVSAADVLTKKVRRPLVQTSAPIPDNWDKTQIPETGYSKISLQRSSAEFKEVEGRFCKTVRGFDMVSIERIQNKALWEVFQWQKNQMKSKNGGRNVTERKLFHGTDSKFVDTICHHNFDWRICGTHGTAFGKGSYFARDAKYSHNYTGDTDVRTMFISRVLVGDYTRGSSDYRRPPSKDGGDINFYDSCVDDVMNPSIFVVFEKHQIYPEYLLQYKTTYSVGVAPAPKPAAAPKTVSIQSAYQPSTASFQYQTHTSYSLFPPNTASSISQSNTASSISQSNTAFSGYQPSTASNISQSNTASSISRSNTASSISQSNTASSISQSNTASSISRSNTASSISRSNTASSISRSNTASSISQSNTASSISRSNTASSISQSNTAFSGYQPSTASNISQYGTDPFISLSNRTPSISRSNTASSISRSNTASSGYQPSTASNISQYGTDPFISLSNRTSSISRSSTASSGYLSSPVSRPKKSSNSCVIA